jgi:hypothetical protein
MCACVCARPSLSRPVQADTITWPQFREAMVSWLSPRASGGAGASPKKRTMGSDDSSVGTKIQARAGERREPCARVARVPHGPGSHSAVPELHPAKGEPSPTPLPHLPYQACTWPQDCLNDSLDC